MGALYHLIPRMYGQKQLYSKRAIELHFWIATIGIVLYIAAMWIAGVMQGLMWREYNEQGFLVYSFAESVAAMFPYYILRVIAGVLYLAGGVIMAYNILMTIYGYERKEAPMPGAVPAAVPAE